MKNLIPTVETSNGRDCDSCNKSSVCKYKDSVTENVGELVAALSDLALPLCININCKEWVSNIETR